MPNFNSVTIIGHLTRDPELRTTSGGKSICQCGIATTDKFKAKDGSWKEDTCFVDFHLWGNSGERFHQWFGKGDAVLISGKLKLETWDDKNTGAKRSKHTINVFNFENCSGKRDEQEQPKTQASEPAMAAASQPALPNVPDDEVPF